MKKRMIAYSQEGQKGKWCLHSLCLKGPLGEEHECVGEIYGKDEEQAKRRADLIANLINRHLDVLDATDLG